MQERRRSTMTPPSTAEFGNLTNGCFEASFENSQLSLFALSHLASSASTTWIARRRNERHPI